MLKRFKVTQPYLVFLHCDECEERMELDHIDTSDKKNTEKKRYIHRCPKCGNAVRTSGAYPVVSYDYETEGEAVSRAQA